MRLYCRFCGLYEDNPTATTHEHYLYNGRKFIVQLVWEVKPLDKETTVPKEIRRRRQTK